MLLLLLLLLTETLTTVLAAINKKVKKAETEIEISSIYLVLHIALIVILESLKDHIQEPQVGQMEEYFRLLFDGSKNVKLTSSSAMTEIS